MIPFQQISGMLLAGAVIASFAAEIPQPSPFVLAQSDVEVIQPPPGPVYGGHTDPEPWGQGEREEEWSKPRAQTPGQGVSEPSPKPGGDDRAN
jgi:hypothetical protein